MSSIVTSIFSSTVGLLWKKAQDAIAKKLKDGDITDERIREIVVRELDDVKTKIDGLARKDLLVSCNFLQDGVQLLIVSLDKSKHEQKAMQSETQDDRGETSRMPSGDESANVMNKALELSHVMGQLKIAASSEFESAKERFKDARKRATDAFCNKALNIQDRIFAAKLRIVSEILECLENPDTAATSCLLFLEKLHDLPAVREIFSVYLGGGVKSIFGKAEQVENVKSVMMINYVLYQFVSKFSSKYCSALAWPTIQLSDRSFNPIWNWQDVSTTKSWGEELIQSPNEMSLDRDIEVYLYAAVNSRGEIVISHNNDIEFISRTGERKVVNQFPVPSREDEEGEVMKQEILGLALDQENNVYVVLYCETTSQNGNVDSHAVLYILDEHCNRVKHKSELNFLPKHDTHLRLAINKNNNIVMTPMVLEDDHVYICDHTGQFKYKFEHEISILRYMSVSDNNEIMLTSYFGDAVHIYTEEGNLKLKIELPAGHVIRGIIVLTNVRDSDSYFLHRYSETGQLETSMFYLIHGGGLARIKSHPSGPVAIARERNITFI
ncbi:Hypothetical predicted protein [Paramuricea clavata]|uniref:Uncharacterized protein n=1 Tax=Paramuricea clavata TaxID=317549 RepID=A0A6S7I929_PARCT|nr:Hypothetical predicted protein [Paramuricea clavata]